MKPGRLTTAALAAMMLCLLLIGCVTPGTQAGALTAKQKALDEWRSLTAPSAQAPRVFVKGDQIRFYFQAPGSVEEFSAEWHHVRVPSSGYKVNAAVLRWNQKLSRIPDGRRGWREAVVISGSDWHRLATNLTASLTPRAPMHAAYYQAFLADGVLYRDTNGAPRFAALGEQPKDVIIEHQFSVEETLDVLARRIEEQLGTGHPGGSLFLMMAPNASRFTQPLLLDRQQRRCVFLTPAALYDTTERGFGLIPTAQGISAMTIEAHGLALLKNPFSSAARLGDLGFETVCRFLRLPLPKSAKALVPLSPAPGMDLDQWEAWLDRYTGTLREDGSLQLLIDGDRFFPRLQQAFAHATNSIHCNVYIFDRDDVAVHIADQLKQRSDEVEVRVLLDRLGSIAAGAAPPATPMEEDFTMPSSIIAYLKDHSQVDVRANLNPWFSSDHSKVFLVDGQSAWLGGMNLGREYRYEWHDLMVELHGPVVASLEDQFRLDWAHAGPLGDLSYLVALLSGPKEARRAPASADWIRVRRLPTRLGWKPFSAAVLGSLEQARSYAYIENPYLFDSHVIIALVRARERGVDVRVVLPRVNDLKPGARSNLVTANYLMQHGVRVYFYPGMTHVKAMLVDGWSCLGSANLNHLSLHVNQEQNIATSDSGFAARLKHDLFEEDFAHSYELTEPVSVDWVDFLADQVLENF